ncbi:MAG: hypothetical protein AAB666_01770 [Patescibacteria group bacterium]
MEDPIAETISNYATSTVNAVKLNQARQAGMWPIWTAPGGATPLNCAGENSGDCGNIGLCSDGPNENMVCNADSSVAGSSGDNGCEEKVNDGFCLVNNLDNQTQKFCSGVTNNGKDLLDSGIVCVDDNNNKKSTYCPKPNTSYGPCQGGVCKDFFKISCSTDADCLVTASSVKCDNIPITWNCDGGIKDKQTCTEDDNCSGGTTDYDCET